jgi:hypothetical protein
MPKNDVSTEKETQKTQQQVATQAEPEVPKAHVTVMPFDDGHATTPPPMVPPFVRRLTSIMPHFGTVKQDEVILDVAAKKVWSRFKVEEVPLASGDKDIKVPEDRDIDDGHTITTVVERFVPTIAAGYLRVKLFGTSGTVTKILIKGTDGVNTELLAEVVGSTALANNLVINLIFPFLSDININTIHFIITGGGTSSRASVEVAATSGDS